MRALANVDVLYDGWAKHTQAEFKFKDRRNKQLKIQNLADAKKAIQKRLKYVSAPRRNITYPSIAWGERQYELEWSLQKIEQAETEMLLKLDEEISSHKDKGMVSYIDGLKFTRKIITRETKDNKLPVADPQ